MMQFRPRLGVEGGERLIHQQHRRVHHHGPGDGDPLPHAAGKLVHQLFRRWRTNAPFAAPAATRSDRSDGRNARHFQSEFDVLRGRQPGKQSMVLKDHRPVRPRSGDRPVIQQCAAAVGPDHSRGDVQQRALSAAAGADDDHEFARLAIQRDVLDGRDIGIAEPLADAGTGSAFPRAESSSGEFCLHRC